MGVGLLGMPGPWARDNNETSDHYTSKIGGLPDWPNEEIDISPHLLQCPACASSLCLIAQVYAPIACDGLKIEERTIYVFGCPTTNCADNPDSWRTLRAQKSCNVVEVCSETLTPATPTSRNWWDMDLVGLCSADDEEEEEDDIDLLELGRALSNAGATSSHCKRESDQSYSSTSAKASARKSLARKRIPDVPVLPCFYLYSQEEPTFHDGNALCANYASLSIKENNGMHVDEQRDEKWDQEDYEYDRALNADRTFLKFKKRVDANPEQCFRYSYGGKPLLASKNLGGPGVCDLCGGCRHFEMQLMSPLLHFLREGGDGLSTHSPDNWSWMTLIIYTCSKNCSRSVDAAATGGSGWTVAKEATLVQYDDSADNLQQLAHFA